MQGGIHILTMTTGTVLFDTFLSLRKGHGTEQEDEKKASVRVTGDNLKQMHICCAIVF